MFGTTTSTVALLNGDLLCAQNGSTFSRDYFTSNISLKRVEHLTTRMENKMEDKKTIRISTMKKSKEPLSGDLLKMNEKIDKELAHLKEEHMKTVSLDELLDEDFTGHEVNALLNTPIKMKYTMEDWDKMYGLENDEKFIRAIFEAVVGDAFDRWTREELLRHLNDLLNERDEALTKCEELIEDNCTLSGIIRRMK